MHRAAVLCPLLVALCPPAWSACSHADFLHDLGVHESGLDPSATNEYGYAGVFQMGEAALQDAGYYLGDPTSVNDWTGGWTGAGGVDSLDVFLASPDVQVQAVVTYHNQLVAQIEHFGLNHYIGSSVGGVTVTLSGMVAGAHLVGIGNLQAFINSGGSSLPKDGNGVPVTTYMAELGGCEIAAVPPSYATMLAAAGGAGVGPAPDVPPGPSAPTPPAPIAVDPGTAFAAASGQTAAALREAIAAIVATLLTLWLAWTTQAGFVAWCRRRVSLFTLKAEIVRACIVLSVVVVVLQ